MKKAILFALIISFAASCKKEDNTVPNNQTPTCQTYHTGSVKAISFKSNPYFIQLDGVSYGTCQGNGTFTINNVSAGGHNFKAVQAAGYVLYPTEYTGYVNVTSCYTQEITFGL